MTEEATIIQEIEDHAAYWHSDMAKRYTVEKHLSQKGINNVSKKIDAMIQSGKLVLIPKPRGDYVKIASL
jgi:hypothetical protein